MVAGVSRAKDSAEVEKSRSSMSCPVWWEGRMGTVLVSMRGCLQGTETQSNWVGKGRKEERMKERQCGGTYGKIQASLSARARLRLPSPWAPSQPAEDALILGSLRPRGPTLGNMRLGR